VTAGLPDGTRVRIRGARPRPAQVAALLLALDLARAADAPARPTAPAWRWAARLEGANPLQVRAPADLEAARRNPY
jgi:hypothetical protein